MSRSFILISDNLRALIKSIFNISKIFSEGHERSLIIRKNTLFSIFLKGISMLCNFILVPITINYLDPGRYGIWLTLSSIVGWMYFFDIGIGNGLRNMLTKSLAEKNIEASCKYISTSYFLIGLITIGILIIFVVLIPLLNWTRILNSPQLNAQELMTVSLIVFSFFSLQFFFRLINTILLADLRSAENDLLGVISSVISLLIIYVLTIISNGSLIKLGLTLSATPVLVLSISTFLLFRGRYKKFCPKLAFVDWSCSRDIMNLGIKFFILQIGATIVYQTANIIIIQLFGPEQVTEFNIAYKYFSIPLMLYIIIVIPLWSAFTDAFTAKDFNWMKTTLSRYLFLTILFSILVVLMLIISPLFYRLWIGAEIRIRFELSIFVSIYTILFMWMSLFIYIINGIGKIKIQVYSSVAEIILNIPLSIFLGRIFGIYGVLTSMIFFVLLRCIWAPIQLKKLMNNTALGIWNQ